MATFIRLTEFKSSEEKEREFFNQENKFVLNEQSDFSKIPGSPIAYWVSNNMKSNFETIHNLSNISAIKNGLSTGNNDEYIRLWYEVNKNNVGFNFKDRESAQKSQLKWFPCNKGGDFRKWYGNNEYLLNWYNDGDELKNFGRIRNNGKHWSRYIYSLEYFFREGLTYTYISSSSFGVRYSPLGFIPTNAGSGIFFEDKFLKYILAFLSTNVAFEMLRLINPTHKFETGDVGKLPFKMKNGESNTNLINSMVDNCIDISRKEWGSRETSWDFTTNELLRHKTTNWLEDAYNNYCTYWKEQFFKLHTNEEELNSIFIDIYDLADELTPDVPLEDITILKDESEIKDGKLVFKKETIIKQFISYAVGCMFGRYSPDREGLILANQGETIDDFREKVPDPSFMPDDDNIIPILEDEYFTDDIVSRFKEFLKATFGAESLAENLDFIAGALSKSKNGSKSPEKTIRDYFLKSFFKDHTRTYKKRPIYWLFTSGKGRGFNALVYMHRYDKTTLAKMRTDYLLELESKLDARMDMLSSDSAREKQEREKLSAQIEELAAYDEVLNNKALSFIDIDLDDGVVVNYAKFEGLVGKV